MTIKFRLFMARFGSSCSSDAQLPLSELSPNKTERLGSMSNEIYKHLNFRLLN